MKSARSLALLTLCAACGRGALELPKATTSGTSTSGTTGGHGTTGSSSATTSGDATSSGAASPTVATLAGDGDAGYVDGPDATAQFTRPFGVAIDSAGNVYVADGHDNAIRVIYPDGNVATLAGDGDAGFADGVGAAAQLNEPTGVAVDAAGNVYVADYGNNRIRRVDPGGHVTTLAGNGSPGFADGTAGPSGTAAFHYPFAVAVDGAGNVYVADANNNRIRKVVPDGHVTTVAGNGLGGFVDGTGGPSGTAELSSPGGLAMDDAGDLYVADTGNNSVRRIDPGGDVITFAGDGTPGDVDGAGQLARFFFPVGLALDAAGNLYVGDGTNNRIREIDPQANVTTLAGNGKAGFIDGTVGPSGTAELHDPGGVAVDDAGNVYFADYYNNCVRVVRR